MRVPRSELRWPAASNLATFTVAIAIMHASIAITSRSDSPHAWDFGSTGSTGCTSQSHTLLDRGLLQTNKMKINYIKETGLSDSVSLTVLRFAKLSNSTIDKQINNHAGVALLNPRDRYGED